MDELSMMKLIGNISSNFLHSSTSISNSIKKSIKQIGLQSNYHSVKVLLFNEHKTNYSQVFEWNEIDNESTRLLYFTLPVDMFPWLLSVLESNHIVTVSDIDNLNVEDASLEIKHFKSLNVSAFAALPLFIDYLDLGGILLVESTTSLVWDEKRKRFLKILSQIISSALSRHNLVETTVSTVETFRKIVENIAEGILLEDKEGAITFVNHQALKIFDHNMHGKNLYDYIPLTEITKFNYLWGDSTFQTYIKKKNDLLVPCICSRSPMNDPDGKYEGCLTILTNLSYMESAEISVNADDVFLLLIKWDDIVGPILDKCYPVSIDSLPGNADIESLTIQLFHSMIAVYGAQPRFDTSSDVLIDLSNIKRIAFNFFDAIEDSTMRGGKQLFFLSVISPVISHVQSIKLREVLSRYSSKLKNNQEIQLYLLHEEILSILCV